MESKDVTTIGSGSASFADLNPEQTALRARLRDEHAAYMASLVTHIAAIDTARSVKNKIPRLYNFPKTYPAVLARLNDLDETRSDAIAAISKWRQAEVARVQDLCSELGHIKQNMACLICGKDLTSEA